MLNNNKLSKLISLVMIVKDEEEFLDGCLASANGIYDELVIVDTGSKDSTKTIAKKYSARIFDYQWNNNFSAARNFALEKATGDWILQLDADEKLEKNSKNKFMELIKQPEHDIYHLYINDVSRDDLFPQIRFFRNNGNFKYAGEVHNQVVDIRVNSNHDHGFADIVIEHYGYSDNIREKKKKFERNIKLLEEKLSKEPSNSYYLYSLACEYYANKDLASALKYFSMISQQGAPLQADVVRDFADTLGKTRQFTAALQLIEKYLPLYPDHPDLYFLAGLSSLSIGDTALCENYFLRALEVKNAVGPYRVWKGSNTYRALHGLALCRIKAGNFAGAVSALNDALKINPDDQFAIDNLEKLTATKNKDG